MSDRNLVFAVVAEIYLFLYNNRQDAAVTMFTVDILGFFP